MEEYNRAMKATVALWDVTLEKPMGTPTLNAFQIPGGARPLTGSEARTVLSQYAFLARLPRRC